MSLTDDLLKLKELDPTTYATWDIVLDHSEKKSHFADAWLQWCLQEAIAARGWEWQVRNWNDPDTKFHIAYVVGDGHEDEAQADFPEAALLACYIAALEAQA